MGYGFAASGNEIGYGNGPLDGMGPLGPEM
jgi:hypothetical protein